MTPQISEFSYGFALTNELVGWLNLSAAPIFPNLIEEGKAGGGYDVKFDKPGLPLYLQFKRAEYMKHPNAIPYNSVVEAGHRLERPFFRFYLMQAKHSGQHQMLLDLDNGQNLVFYVAPRFYKSDQINAAWISKTVASQSIFVPPQSIGPLPDDEKHCIAYDDDKTYFCSEIRPIEAMSAADLQRKLLHKLERETEPLRTVVDRALSIARNVKERPRYREDAQLRRQLFTGATGIARDTPLLSEREEIRRPRDRTREEQALENLAEIALQDFDSQLVIVQEK